MNSPPVLRAGLLDGVAFTANDDAVARRFAELGATEGDGVLVHRAVDDRPQAALDAAWDAIREHALPPDKTHRLILLIAPYPGDAHAAATRAGFENLARTLSIEWARYRTRPVAILPDRDTPVAELAAFLASPAGAYYAGCAFTLRRPTGPRPSPPSGSPAPPRTPPAPSPSG